MTPPTYKHEHWCELLRNGKKANNNFKVLSRNNNFQHLFFNGNWYFPSNIIFGYFCNEKLRKICLINIYFRSYFVKSPEIMFRLELLVSESSTRSQQKTNARNLTCAELELLKTKKNSNLMSKDPLTQCYLFLLTSIV